LYHKEWSLNLVVDTSVVLAVLTSEPERARLVQLTRDADLIAPASVHWEIGNALSAMIKRGRLTVSQASVVLKNYERIPIRFVEVSLVESVKLAADQKLYAYDAYLIICARDQKCGLVSLDTTLAMAALDAGVTVIEVPKQ
jgi:predicted nucleic acid-binding protein